jgi:hypothetical protein
MISYQGKEFITLNDKIYFPGNGSGGKIIKAYYKGNLVYPRTTSMDDIISGGGGMVDPPLLLRFSNTWNTSTPEKNGGDYDSHCIVFDTNSTLIFKINYQAKSAYNGKLDVDNTTGLARSNANPFGSLYPIENIVFKKDFNSKYPQLLDGYYWLCTKAYGESKGVFYSTVAYSDDTVKLNYRYSNARNIIEKNKIFVIAVLKVINHEVSRVIDQEDLYNFIRIHPGAEMYSTVINTLRGTVALAQNNYFNRI